MTFSAEERVHPHVGDGTGVVKVAATPDGADKGHSTRSAVHPIRPLSIPSTTPC